jgi:hypothetical protein
MNWALFWGELNSPHHTLELIEVALNTIAGT